jgi:hypothetical protein
LSSLDEFANFEIASLLPQESEDSLKGIKGSYARDALRLGLELSHTEGFNPYKFGVIGSSDSHNASSPTDESNYHGKLPMMDGSAGLRTDEATLLPAGLNPVTRWGSGGLAAVWSQGNTRASIYDALERKETFATSGPRISVRFFGGWEFDQNLSTDPDAIPVAYATGVPMGGHLGVPTTNGSPDFLVIAMKDPEGANLDRVQIIKAWVDSEGVSHEKVFDVAASDGREVDTLTGKLPAVGNTVNVDAATYSNDIGDELLATVWTDPEFDVAHEATFEEEVTRRVAADGELRKQHELRAVCDQRVVGV